jgi:toxin ParE1/3/4
MRIVFAALARAGLRDIARYIATDNPARARSFSRMLREAALEIAHHPSGYPVVVRHLSDDIRRKAWRDYLIFYRINDSTVTIIDIQHGARDYSALLEPAPPTDE